MFSVKDERERDDNEGRLFSVLPRVRFLVGGARSLRMLVETFPAEYPKGALSKKSWTHCTWRTVYFVAEGLKTV